MSENAEKILLILTLINDNFHLIEKKFFNDEKCVKVINFNITFFGGLENRELFCLYWLLDIRFTRNFLYENDR